MEQEFYIYKITCLPTNKVYIGQTQKLKHKDGKPYNYGIAGRWCDHVSTSKKSDSPLHTAIREYGIQSFTQELIETVSQETVDEREAYWIRELNTKVPNGFNVVSQTRCKHRDSTSIANLYLSTATEVELKVIKNNGIPKLVYVYVTTPTERKRFTFGQSKDSCFKEALDDATEFVNIFSNNNVKIKQDKLLEFQSKVLQKVRIVPFNKTIVAVYLKSETEQKRVCFGGKHIDFEDAKQKAEEFVSGLNYIVLENNLSKSRQQVATLPDEADSGEEK
jgi:group I intron endonuclease